MVLGKEVNNLIGIYVNQVKYNTSEKLPSTTWYADLFVLITFEVNLNTNILSILNQNIIR